jgi:hypothetical protein
VRRDAYDSDTWLALLLDLTNHHADVAEPYLERCLDVFPTAVRRLGWGPPGGGGGGGGALRCSPPPGGAGGGPPPPPPPLTHTHTHRPTRTHAHTISCVPASLTRRGGGATGAGVGHVHGSRVPAAAL